VNDVSEGNFSIFIVEVHHYYNHDAANGFGNPSIKPIDIDCQGVIGLSRGCNKPCDLIFSCLALTNSGFLSQILPQQFSYLARE
jgi:hypothetical protein